MTSSDDEGFELPDVATARETAIQAARSVIAEEVMIGRVPLKHRIEVEDEDRRPVLTLPFRAAVTFDQ